MTPNIFIASNKMVPPLFVGLSGPTRPRKKSKLLTQAERGKKKCDFPVQIPRWVYVVGIAAGVIGSLAFFPQSFHLLFIDKKATDLTFGTLFLCIFGKVLWIAYGIGAKDMVVAGFSIISLISYVFLVMSRILYKK